MGEVPAGVQFVVPANFELGAGRKQILLLARGGLVEGQQQQVLNLVEGIDRRRYSLCVALDRAGPMSDSLAALGIDTHVCRMSSWRSPTRLISKYLDARQLLRLAKSRDVKLVHAHDHFKSAYAQYVSTCLAVPSLVHARGPMSERDVRKHQLHGADAIIAIAQRYVDDLVGAGIDADRIALVDDSVDLSRFNEANSESGFLTRLAGCDGKIRVGIVGRIESAKRTVEFLNMAASLPSALREQTCIVIVGGCPNASFKTDVQHVISKLGLESQVRLIGRVEPKDMPRMLSGLDILTTLSGGSIMFEAMAMGVTVLSVRSDGRHSKHTRHRETAWCVDGEDPNAAAKALALLMSNSALRQRIGEAGRAHMAQFLSAPSMVEKTQCVYDGLLAGIQPSSSLGQTYRKAKHVA